MISLLFRCLSDIEENTTHIANIKAYLLTALYNAPNTISNYYGAEVYYYKYENVRNEVQSAIPYFDIRFLGLTGYL
ncbi:MAG: hypothetical protein K1W35_01660 [Lachnospiraceae bacterium]